MSKFALIKDSVVYNIIITSDESFITNLGNQVDMAVEVTESVQCPNIGDLYENGVFTPRQSEPDVSQYMPANQQDWPEIPTNRTDALNKLAARLKVLEDA